MTECPNCGSLDVPQRLIVRDAGRVVSGYHSCARCGERIGPVFAGVDPASLSPIPLRPAAKPSQDRIVRSPTSRIRARCP